MRAVSHYSGKGKKKQISFGWKHRFYDNKPYVQTREPQGDGSITISLDRNVEYTVEKLINIGVSLFQNPKAQSYIAQSTVKHGYSTGDDRNSFQLPDGHETGLFEYQGFYNIKSSRTNLFINTTTNQKFLKKEDFVDSQFLDTIVKDIESKKYSFPATADDKKNDVNVVYKRTLNQNSDDEICSPPKLHKKVKFFKIKRKI